jgi:hypothetical protein
MVGNSYKSRRSKERAIQKFKEALRISKRGHLPLYIAKSGCSETRMHDVSFYLDNNHLEMKAHTYINTTHSISTNNNFASNVVQKLIILNSRGICCLNTLCDINCIWRCVRVRAIAYINAKTTVQFQSACVRLCISAPNLWSISVCVCVCVCVCVFMRVCAWVQARACV